MSIVDLLIVAAAVAYAVSGYRNGAVIGLFSLAGFLLGAIIGVRLAKPLSQSLAGGRAQVPVAIGTVLVLALLGQVGALYLGHRLRAQITWHAGRVADAAIGAALGVLSVLVVSWMIAVPLASSPYPGLAAAVRRSGIVRAVDGVMPDPIRHTYSSLREYLDRSGFPPVLGDLQATRIVDVGPPDTALLRSQGVTRGHASTFKIRGEAPSCDRAIEGSGFVYAPEHMLTNAHVVAGTDRIAVEVGGRRLRASVVVFDPRRDVAVLDVPGLAAPALTFAPAPSSTGANAIVLGYPEDGPFDVRPARIRARENISGRDIYGSHTVVREIYSIRGLVRSGNSGGPLITPDGSVLGMVFATALDSSDTGFVLTDTEIKADADAGRSASGAQDTGRCAA